MCIRDSKYIWLYKVKFAIPDENYTTKGDSIEFTTPEIVGQFIKRSDGLWKAEHVALPTESVAAAWFGIPPLQYWISNQRP